MEKSDIDLYMENPSFAEEILKKYNITDYRAKINEDVLKWLK